MSLFIQLRLIIYILQGRLAKQQQRTRDRNNAVVRIARWVEQNYLRRKDHYLTRIAKETLIMQAMMEKQTTQASVAKKIANWIEFRYSRTRDDTAAIKALQENFELEFQTLKEDFACRFEGGSNGTALAMDQQTKIENNNNNNATTKTAHHDQSTIAEMDNNGSVVTNLETPSRTHRDSLDVEIDCNVACKPHRSTGPTTNDRKKGRKKTRKKARKKRRKKTRQKKMTLARAKNATTDGIHGNSKNKLSQLGANTKQSTAIVTTDDEHNHYLNHIVTAFVPDYKQERGVVIQEQLQHRRRQ